MAYTRTWEETHPAGTEAASLGDNRIRALKVDLGERLEDMLYGFNGSDGTGHEALYGVKKLLFRELAADPTIVDTGNELFLYTKNVSDVSELFFKNNADQVKQITSAGKLNVLDADGAVMKTGDQTIAGVKTLASPVINTAISGSAVADEDDMDSDSATLVATQQSIKKYVDNQKQVCKMYRNASAVTPSTGYVKVQLDAEAYDPDEIGASYKITPTIAGYYQVNGQVYWHTATDADKQYGTALYKNGAAFAQSLMEAAGAGDFVALPTSDIVYCDGVDDYLELYAYSESAASFSNGSTKTYLSIALVSAD